MAGGFGLPVLNLQQALGGLGTAYGDAYDRAAKKTALSRLGEQLQAGDFAGGAQTAFAAGDVDTGLGILKLGETRRQNALTEKASQDFSAGFLGPLGMGDGSVGGPRADASPASRALPSFADNTGPSGDFVSKLATRESGNNPNARNPMSSATGLGQFTTGTWKAVAQAHPELGLTPDGRTSPKQSVRAIQAHTADNEKILSRANLPVNDATRYAVHFLGAGGGPRFVAGTLANPDRPASSIVAPDQVAANRAVFFDRSGRAKTAGEVMGDFERSFSGGGRGAPWPAGQQVAYADTEEQTQALEQQTASLEPGADLPAPDAMETSFRVPGEDPIAADVGARRLLPSTDPNARNAQPGILPTSSSPSKTTGQPAIPTLGSSVPGGRSMTTPEADGGADAPTQVAENTAGRPPVASDATIGNVPARAIAQSPLAARLPFLTKALANPYLPEGQRQLAQTFLKEALEQARMPESVREFYYARANGLTQAKTPAEYGRESKGPTTLAPGSSVLSADGKSIALTAPDRERENKVTADIEARKAGAADLGLQPGSPAYQSYVLTGKMPREDQQPLTASDKRAILEADDAVVSAETAIGNLTAAKGLSAKAYAGPLASARGWATGSLGSEAGQATQELDNLVTTNALGQLKAIFGAAPTEGERKILLDIQGSSNLPHALRVKIYDRGIALAERRLDMQRERAAELRGQT